MCVHDEVVCVSLSAEREDLLNGRLQELLSVEGIPAEAEVASARHRLDVKVFLGEFAIVLEAKTGFSASKKQSARKDALARLEQEHADAVIAVCYPENSTRKTLNSDTRLLVSMHATKNWVKSTPSGLAQLIRRLPHELGDPDRMARSLSDSLDLAVERLTENQSRELATALDYPEKEGAKRAMLVIASAAMFHARLDDHLEGLRPIWDARTARDPGGPTQFTGTWPPVKLQDALTGNDLIASLDEAWNLILALDYKPVFETARAALAAAAQSYEVQCCRPFCSLCWRPRCSERRRSTARPVGADFSPCSWHGAQRRFVLHLQFRGGSAGGNFLEFGMCA